MKRRTLIKNAVGLSLAFTPLSKVLSMPVGAAAFSGPARPVTVYNNWSAYDELSDNVLLTEELAMKELDELLRLQKAGAAFDYYMMDAFWFDKTGGYRVWQKERWPNGPDQWIKACRQNNIIPGLWFSVNNLIQSDNGHFLEPIAEWQDSISTDPNALCLFSGGYLPHFAETLHMYAAMGIRMFKFDFANFSATTQAAEKIYTRSEIQEMNKRAFIDALQQLRKKYPDIMLIAYNGFGGDMNDTYTPFKKTVDHRWLEVMDTVYCGDPRFSDLPAINIWRSMDIYSDHMVRQFEFNEIPIHRIDNCGFMIGTTGTCYKRGTQAWKGMQILELARGGWVNVFHGNLELLDANDAKWFARTQHLYMQLQKYGRHESFGNIPGQGKAYGFLASDKKGKLCTVVNPSQQFVDMELPAGKFTKSSVIYSDGGYRPALQGNRISLGPEQLAVVAFDKYADERYDLGIDETINIPLSCEPMQLEFTSSGKNTINGTCIPVAGKNIRIFFQQFADNQLPYRSKGGSPPKGKAMDELFIITATQRGKLIPIKISYDKIIWSGLSWAAGEIKAESLDAKEPMEIQCLSKETENLRLSAAVYAVSYQK